MRESDPQVERTLIRGKVLAEAAGLIAVRRERSLKRREVREALARGAVEAWDAAEALDRLNAEFTAATKRLERAVQALNRWRSREGSPELNDAGDVLTHGTQFTVGIVCGSPPLSAEATLETVEESPDPCARDRRSLVD